MGAVRLQFTHGRDDWEYGFITLQILLNSSLILPNNLSLFNYEDDAQQEVLKKQLEQGQVVLNHYQTLCFIKINDLLCKILLKGKENDGVSLFALVSVLTSRFKNLAAFETYYLRYSTHVITFIKEEFNKEPGLLDRLNNFLNT